MRYNLVINGCGMITMSLIETDFTSSDFIYEKFKVEKVIRPTYREYVALCGPYRYKISNIKIISEDESLYFRGEAGLKFFHQDERSIIVLHK